MNTKYQKIYKNYKDIEINISNLNINNNKKIIIHKQLQLSFLIIIKHLNFHNSCFFHFYNFFKRLLSTCSLHFDQLLQN